jgi:hypothetical protein
MDAEMHHHRQVLARARELALAISRIQHLNWEQCIQQTAVANAQLEALAATVYGKQASVQRYRDAAAILQPNTNDFPVQQLLPPRPDNHDILELQLQAEHTADPTTIAAYDRECLELAKLCANCASTAPQEIKTSKLLQAANSANMCSAVFTGQNLRS